MNKGINKWICEKCRGEKFLSLEFYETEYWKCDYTRLTLLVKEGTKIPQDCPYILEHMTQK